MDTERGVLNTGVYWGEKGRASGRGRWGGIALGEIPNVDDRGMDAANYHGTCIPACNKPVHSANIPQNLQYNVNFF